MAFPFGGTYRNDALKHLIRAERPVVFDIGANEGQTIASLLSAFPQASIHAFEPIPDLARNLQERWKRSPIVPVNALPVGERAEVRWGRRKSWAFRQSLPRPRRQPLAW